jgi:hypothetical protein
MYSLRPSMCIQLYREIHFNRYLHYSIFHHIQIEQAITMQKKYKACTTPSRGSRLLFWISEIRVKRQATAKFTLADRCDFWQVVTKS